MSTFICHAVVTKSHETEAKSEMQFEHDLFEANAAALAHQARHQKISRVATAVGATWTSLAARLTQRSRDAQARKGLREKLENMPAHMLADIGVDRDQLGRFCFRNEFGMLVELTSAETDTPAVHAAPAGRAAYAAG